MRSVAAILADGRLAAAILEAPPDDLDAGYTNDELAAQYSATDRLLHVFHELDQRLSSSLLEMFQESTEREEVQR